MKQGVLIMSLLALLGCFKNQPTRYVLNEIDPAKFDAPLCNGQYWMKIYDMRGGIIKLAIGRVIKCREDDPRVKIGDWAGVNLDNDESTPGYIFGGSGAMPDTFHQGDGGFVNELGERIQRVDPHGDFWRNTEILIRDGGVLFTRYGQEAMWFDWINAIRQKP